MSSKALKRFFGAMPLDRITPETVEKFKTSHARKKSDFTGRRLRPATINRESACLKILFNRFEDTVPKNLWLGAFFQTLRNGGFNAVTPRSSEY